MLTIPHVRDPRDEQIDSGNKVRNAWGLSVPEIKRGEGPGGQRFPPLVWRSGEQTMKHFEARA